MPRSGSPFGRDASSARTKTRATPVLVCDEKEKKIPRGKSSRARSAPTKKATKKGGAVQDDVEEIQTQTLTLGGFEVLVQPETSIVTHLDTGMQVELDSTELHGNIESAHELLQDLFLAQTAPDFRDLELANYANERWREPNANENANALEEELREWIGGAAASDWVMTVVSRSTLDEQKALFALLPGEPFAARVPVAELTCFAAGMLAWRDLFYIMPGVTIDWRALRTYESNPDDIAGYSIWTAAERRDTDEANDELDALEKSIQAGQAGGGVAALARAQRRLRKLEETLQDWSEEWEAEKPRLRAAMKPKQVAQVDEFLRETERLIQRFGLLVQGYDGAIRRARTKLEDEPEMSHSQKVKLMEPAVWYAKGMRVADGQLMQTFKTLQRFFMAANSALSKSQNASGGRGGGRGRGARNTKKQTTGEKKNMSFDTESCRRS